MPIKDRPQTSQHFIAIATGQQIANLPPILQLGRPGDHVSLLTSKGAQSQDWVSSSMEILRTRGFKVETTLIEEDTAAAFARGTSEAIARLPEAPVIAIVNGGQKPWILAMVAACPDAAEVAYGESPKSELTLFAKSDPTSARRVAYNFDPPLTLDEVLRCANAAQMDGEGKEVWNSQRAAGQRRVLDPVKFPSDEEIKRDFEFAHKRAKELKQAQDSDYPMAEVALSKSSDKARGKFARALTQFLNSVFKGMPSQNPEEKHRPVTETDLSNDDLKRVISAARNLLDHARKACALEAPEVGVERLGGNFEHLVTDAVVAHIEQNSNSVTPAVASIWWGVKVRQLSAPLGTVGAEWDVVLVFRNGMIMHLECKAAAVEKKDLDARKHVLGSHSSSLAKFVLVIPGYTAFAAQPWFVDLTKFGNKAKDFGSESLLRFTRSGQPSEFEDRSCTPTITKILLPFDEQLQELLKRYAS